jgi:hypothetical protein
MLRAHSSLSFQQMPARHPQIRQGKQRDELGRVLGQPSVAHLRVPELALEHTERMLNLGMRPVKAS